MQHQEITACIQISFMYRIFFPLESLSTFEYEIICIKGQVGRFQAPHLTKSQLNYVEHLGLPKWVFSKTESATALEETE